MTRLNWMTLVAALALSGCVSQTATPVAESSDANNVNGFRAQNGVAALRRSAKADAAARAHAEDMARNGFFSHSGSNGSTFGQRLRAAGCQPFGAENIARGQPSFDAAMRAWIGSAGHRRNLLNRDATAYGWAEVGGTWVMVFSTGC